MYPPSDAVYYPLYAKCCELDLPVCINTGIPGPPLPAEAQNPIHLDRVCIRFPELKLCMIHGADPWWDTAIRLMLKYRNLRLMTSAWSPKRLPESLLHYLRTRGQGPHHLRVGLPGAVDGAHARRGRATSTSPTRSATRTCTGTARAFFFDRLDGDGRVSRADRRTDDHRPAPRHLRRAPRPIASRWWRRTGETLTYAAAGRPLEPGGQPAAGRAACARATTSRSCSRTGPSSSRSCGAPCAWGCTSRPINWHLAPDEAAYIVEDCGASALVASADLGAGARPGSARPPRSTRLRLPPRRRWRGRRLRRLRGGARRANRRRPVDDECEGIVDALLVGHDRPAEGHQAAGDRRPARRARPAFVALMSGLYGFGESSVYLSPAPLYHAAPAGWTNGVHRLGGTAVVMDRFDPLETLAAHRGRPGHPRAVRADPPGAAAQAARGRAQPVRPVEPARSSCTPRRRARPRSSGPRSSGSARSCTSTTRAARASGSAPSAPRSGSPTRARSASRCSAPVHIVDADGTELRPGEVGQVWFESADDLRVPRRPGEDRRARSTTTGGAASATWARVDDDGYLYLTDRVTNMIISGGVNIYPREIEDVLILHPRVADVAVVGVPDAEMGESVRGGRAARRADALDGIDARATRSSGADRVLPRAAVAVQVPAVGRVRRRAATAAHRQAGQAAAAGLGARALAGQRAPLY